MRRRAGTLLQARSLRVDHPSRDPARPDPAVSFPKSRDQALLTRNCGLTMRILIVDDEPNTRHALRLTLQSMSHDVDEAGSGPEALREVERTDFDAVFVDLRLSQEPCVDLLEQLRAGRPRLDVVAVTSEPSVEAAVDAIRRGAFDYLAKPFSFYQIAVALERIIRVRASHLPDWSTPGDARADGSIEVGRMVSLEELEAEHVRRVVSQCASFEEAAQVLGIDPSTLYRKRKRFGF
jgi:DNA-binding NtrC family response regulator